MKDFIIKNLTKIINIFLVVTVCLVAIFLPHTRSVVENSPYSDNQKTARIDISNEGFEGSSLEIVRISDSNSIVNEAKWLKSDIRNGYYIQSKKGKLDFTIKIINDGVFTINLRGVDYKSKSNPKKRIPIVISYNNFRVNDTVIFNEEKEIWHDSPFKYTCSVKDGDILKISIDWSPFAAIRKN